MTDDNAPFDQKETKPPQAPPASRDELFVFYTIWWSLFLIFACILAGPLLAAGL